MRLVYFSTVLFAMNSAQRSFLRSRTQTRLFAAPRKKLPERRVTISCSACGTKLYRYAKGNGAGSRLVKVYKERIVNDFTDEDKPCTCPNLDCAAEFAREDVIHGRPAFKIIQGKVIMK